MDIVITHGVQTVASQWAAVADRLPGRVVVPNRRGRADSPPMDAGYDLGTEVVDLHRVLDTCDNPVLIGHSYGGLIAVLTAAERDDLAALVLYEPVVPVDGPFSLGAVHAAMEAGDRDLAYTTLSIEIIGEEPRFVEAFRVRDPAGWAAQLDLLDSTCSELRALNRLVWDPAVLKRIQVPTHVLLGERTDRPELIYGRAARSLVEGIDGADLTVLPRQGHIAHLLKPDVLADAIKRFL